MEPTKKAVDAAKARVRIEKSSPPEWAVVYFDGVKVFRGWEPWAEAFVARLVVALACNVHEFQAIAMVTESIVDLTSGSALDPHPSYVFPKEIDTRKVTDPRHLIEAVSYDEVHECFYFVASCPVCNGTGKGADRLNCNHCGGSTFIDVSGDGREI